MKYGLTMFATDTAIRPDELAREAEARGFESLLFPEHTHIPASRKTPYPAGGALPEEYRRTHDPFIALAMAAAATKRLKIGTGICLVVERDPITLAKQVASLDFLSNGRFLFGIGGGWNVEEMENHGTDFRSRWKLLRERIEAMKAIWQEDEAAYSGELVKFDAIWSYPKPVQKPHPPILLGGHGTKALERVVRYCDGWMPISVRAGDVLKGIAELRELEARAGRAPRSIQVSVFWAPADAETLATWEEHGVGRAIFGLPPAGRDQVLPLLDEYAKLM